jgi:hypothetical protein
VNEDGIRRNKMGSAERIVCRARGVMEGISWVRCGDEIAGVEEDLAHQGQP